MMAVPVQAMVGGAREPQRRKEGRKKSERSGDWVSIVEWRPWRNYTSAPNPGRLKCRCSEDGGPN